MKAKLINEMGEKTYAVVFDKGDEVVEGLLSLASQKKIQARHNNHPDSTRHTPQIVCSEKK